VKSECSRSIEEAGNRRGPRGEGGTGARNCWRKGHGNADSRYGLDETSADSGTGTETPERAFLSLAQHIDVEFLTEAFRRTRKDGATGVDGQNGKAYEEGLEENLQSLLDRFKSGRYKAPPVRRTFVPKGDGGQRPIGIPTFEDKVLQRAVTMVLEAVYEQDFLPCSYGYRPGRSAHEALEDLWRGLMEMKGGWVLELDIGLLRRAGSFGFGGFSTRGCAMGCCVGRSTSGWPPASWRVSS
jgi:hypothetical protein